MIVVGFALEYPWPDHVERDVATFALWDGYGCTTPAEAHVLLAGFSTAWSRSSCFDHVHAAQTFWKGNGHRRVGCRERTHVGPCLHTRSQRG